MQLNFDKFTSSKYLCVAEAVQRVGDDELVYEMLNMLNLSIGKDWSDFEACFKAEQFTSAANILHSLKGTVPIFSDKLTEEIMQKTESLLRNSSNSFELKNAIEELRHHTLGFMDELRLWVNEQNLQQ